MYKHFVSDSYQGVHCEHEMWGTRDARVICGQPATHKVGEEIPYDEPGPRRHNFTAYVCCEHFGRILGLAAQLECGLKK